jgi:hypothetical protein
VIILGAINHFVTIKQIRCVEDSRVMAKLTELIGSEFQPVRHILEVECVVMPWSLKDSMNF